MAKSETQVLLEICKWLHDSEFFFWRSNNVPAAGRSFGAFRSLPKYTPPGLPNIMIVHDGIFIGLEVKRPTEDGAREKNGRKLRMGKLTPEQGEFGIKLTIAGGHYACVRSRDEAEKFLAGLFVKGWVSKA